MASSDSATPTVSATVRHHILSLEQADVASGLDGVTGRTICPPLDFPQAAQQDNASKPSPETLQDTEIWPSHRTEELVVASLS